MARPALSSVIESPMVSKQAHHILSAPIKQEIELKKSFLAALEDASILDAIENAETFSSILYYALDRGLITQKILAERLRYANSQVGRWAAGKAVPQYITRERVLEEMSSLLSDSLDALVVMQGETISTENRNRQGDQAGAPPE